MKDILNPVRVLYVEDWMKVARIILSETDKEWSYLTADLKQIKVERKSIQLLQRYESLLKEKLTKEHFVCGVEKPINPFNPDSDVFANELFEYEAAQAKVMFTGFEGKNLVTIEGVSIMFYDHQTCFKFREISFSLVNPTVGDLIHELDYYNRTAQTKIKLEWSQAAIQRIINQT